MFQTFQIVGVIQSIEEPVTISENYTERVFVVKYESNAEYSYDVALTLVNGKMNMIDAFREGEKVTVHFNLSSRKAKGNYYTKLNAWKIER